jgi:hypothetical protein
MACKRFRRRCSSPRQPGSSLCRGRTTRASPGRRRYLTCFSSSRQRSSTRRKCSSCATARRRRQSPHRDPRRDRGRARTSALQKPSADGGPTRTGQVRRKWVGLRNARAASSGAVRDFHLRCRTAGVGRLRRRASAIGDLTVYPVLADSASSRRRPLADARVRSSQAQWQLSATLENRGSRPRATAQPSR